MKKLTALLLAFVLILPSYTAFAKTSAVFLYVATDGDDSACGTETAPLKTLSAAIKLAETIPGKVVINLRGGVYPMTETINLTEKNSGLVIRSYPGEKAELTGSNELPMSIFSKCTDTAFLDALVDQTYRDQIISAKITDYGVTDLGKIRVQGFFGGAKDQGYAPTLTVGDKALTLAKYPNEGYLYTETIVVPIGYQYNGQIRNTEYTLSDKRYRNWKGKDSWAVAFFTYDWRNTVAQASFTENDTIKGWTVAWEPAEANRRVRFFNIPEEMDMPGEYYIDRDTGMLYLIPTSDMKSYSKLYFSSYNKDFFTIQNASDILFSGIRFSGTCKKGFDIQDCSEIVFDNCDLTAIGDMAISFLRCTESGVKNSYLHVLGSDGVYFELCGDRQTLTPSGCFVTNCHFESFSQYKITYCPAIKFENVVEAKAMYNEIHDSPHMAIQYLGNDISIMYNDIYDVCQDTSDAGAVYTGRRWDTFGNEIKYNYFHDMVGINSSTGMKMQAVYLDDMSAGTEVFGNVFYNVDAVALYGGGSYNTFCNNIMINCLQPLWFDARGVNWGWGDSEQWTWLNTIDYQSGIWAQKYPQINQLVSNNPKTPQNNLLENNVYYNTPAFRIDSPVEKHSIIRNNVKINGNGSFKDYTNKDFTVLPNSEIYKKVPNFQSIPFNKIGRYAYNYTEIYEELPYRNHTANDYLTVSETETGYSFTNKDATPFNLTIISPTYKTVNGLKSLTSVSLNFKTVIDSADVTANKNDIILSTDNLEPVK